MQDRRQRRYLYGIVAFGVALFVGLWHLGTVLSALQVVLSMVSFVVVGLSIAFILNVPMRMIENRLMAPLNKRLGSRWARIRRPIALVLTVLLLLAALLFIVLMVAPEFARTVAQLAGEIPAFLQRLDISIDQLFDEWGIPQILSDVDTIDWQKIGNTLVNLLKNGAGSVLRGTVTVATNVVSSVVSFVVGIILALYVLLSKERLSDQMKRTVRAYLPTGRAERVLEVAALSQRTFTSFVGGQFFEAVILGCMFFVGMTIFGFPFAPMVSVLVGATAMIPIFGAFIGWFVGAFMIVVDSGLVTAAWFSLFFIVLQQIESNLVYPNVVGKSVMLPGLWVLVAVTIGGNLAGIAGMLVSVPLCSILYALLRDAVNRRNREKENVT